MATELIRPLEAHIPDVARLMFEAFSGIADRHGFPRDMPTLDVATMAAGAFVMRPDVYGVIAREDGKVVACNFAQLSDAVAGVGPMCVDPAAQSRGLGRLLMRDVVDHATARHGPMVRLMQDSFNTTSLGLYASLGFVVREPCALMSVPPATDADATIRPLTPADVEECDALCVSTYKVSRRNELATMIEHGPAMGCVPHGRFVAGRAVASVIPGFFGFAVGQTPTDLLATAQAAAGVGPPPVRQLFVPLRHGPFFADALARGFRVVKVMHLMTVGPYEDPTGAWSPSVAF